jgi:hypothetical protein
MELRSEDSSGTFTILIFFNFYISKSNEAIYDGQTRHGPLEQSGQTQQERKLKHNSGRKEKLHVIPAKTLGTVALCQSSDPSKDI